MRWQTELLRARLGLWTSRRWEATLASEPESVWREILAASGWRISVEMVLARNYCNLLGRCTENLPLVELLKRHLLPSALALNELNKFPHFSAAETLEKEFQSLAQVESGIRRAHILMCSEPPFFCQMFRGLGKPIFGYIGNPFGAYLRPGHPQEGRDSRRQRRQHCTARERVL
ncbi:unnamed protein product [Durusdinium trenchii]|uniref:Uncharacterized protein n=1 Tax=Durusdinium trenchii TaxID=1381693 RepID=A0ABP0K968_9DINO